MQPQQKRFYLVLDFEANCSGNQVKDHEIIEFPSVLIDAVTGIVVSEFRRFVRTIKTGRVSGFIKELTGITDEQLQAEGIEWVDCLREFDAWCEHHGVDATSTTVVTCGDWDLKTMFPRQLLITHTQPSSRIETLFGCWNNMKVMFRDAQNYHRLCGMESMLADLKIRLVGRHHSGIDDCRNIARLCQFLQQNKGCDPTRVNRMQQEPYWYQAQSSAYRRTKRGDIVTQAKRD